MKRFFSFAILFIFIFSFRGYAQRSDFRPKFYLGAGGGVLFSMVDFVPNIPQGYRMGYHGGVSAKYISENHLGLIGEVNFAQRGWKEKFEDNPDFSYSRTLNYLEIPLMTHVYFGKKIRFIFNAGPQISFLLSNASSMNEALKNAVDAGKVEKTHQYAMPDRKFDYGLIGGMGMALKTGIGDFDLEGRFYFGLGDIFDSRISSNSHFSRSASRSIQAKLTYYMKL